MSKSKSLEFFTTFSRFVSTRLLGEGGSGYVYEVKDENGQIFAAKLLKNQGVTNDKRRRFKNEIIFCQRSTHPNIVPVIDSGVFWENSESSPFYVMPFYDSSLRNLLNSALKPETIIKLFFQLLDGIEAAHLQGIVHRDLKPENILYKTIDARLALADFGIARFTEDELYTAVETKAQDRLANFQYAAPEQRVRGKNIDQRTDIYAIGLILNEMFSHEIPQGTGYKTISSVSPEYSYLDEIVEKMLRQNQGERPESIQEIKDLLKIRGADYVSKQKLNTLKSSVIPNSEIDDPLVVSPIEIVDFEWDRNLLTLVLSQPVNQKWKNALLNMGSHQSLWNKEPHRFTFEGNLAKIHAEERQVQSVIDYFKSWIPQTTQRYKEDVEAEQRQKEKQELEKIRIAVEVEEAKIRLRKEVRL